MLSDALHSYGDDIDEETLRVLAAGTLSARARVRRSPRTSRRCATATTWRRCSRATLAWPARPQDRDLLYYLAETFRARLVNDLPADKDRGAGGMRDFAHRAKALLVELAEISLECAQLVIATDEHGDVGAARLVPGRGHPRPAAPGRRPA